jgi:hypothetical protein
MVIPSTDNREMGVQFSPLVPYYVGAVELEFYGGL